MSRTKTDLFKINGKPMFAPDSNVDFSYEDLDDSDSGRDESGYMHRIVVRYKVMTGSFVFSYISDEDMQYMESLFPDEPDFDFTRPSRLDPNTPVTTRCYRTKYGISWRNAKTGDWRNYKFNIVEC